MHNIKAHLNEYSATFKKVPFAFGRDYYNAAVCAVKIGDHSSAIDFLHKNEMNAFIGRMKEWK